MGKMNKIIGFFIATAGMYLIVHYSGWGVAIGVALCFWAHNLEKHWRK